ncbi:MAG: hypothetical protein ACTTIC_03730 [Helicobacteraceae bacterium]
MKQVSFLAAGGGACNLLIALALLVFTACNDSGNSSNGSSGSGDSSKSEFKLDLPKPTALLVDKSDFKPIYLAMPSDINGHSIFDKGSFEHMKELLKGEGGDCKEHSSTIVCTKDGDTTTVTGESGMVKKIEMTSTKDGTLHHIAEVAENHTWRAKFDLSLSNSRMNVRMEYVAMEKDGEPKEYKGYMQLNGKVATYTGIKKNSSTYHTTAHFSDGNENIEIDYQR